MCAWGDEHRLSCRAPGSPFSSRTYEKTLTCVNVFFNLFLPPTPAALYLVVPRGKILVSRWRSSGVSPCTIASISSSVASAMPC